MAEVHVVVPKPGDGNPKAVPDVLCVHPGEVITWRFHVAYPAVKYIEIEFGDQLTEHYFDNTSEKWKYGKGVTHGNNPEPVYGMSPTNYPVDTTQIDKYSIKCYAAKPASASDKPLAFADPEIVVDTP